ncbi:hypothetical protein Fmac_024715 [Flemingia macrophylla]|uniref:Uncharacterized protein n=1 Tax=Flemingia macrophylla TaxID=520843 RepID=A0ABD1LQ59_9FABA
MLLLFSSPSSPQPTSNPKHLSRRWLHNIRFHINASTNETLLLHPPHHHH